MIKKGFRFKKLRKKLPDAPLAAIRSRREIEDEGLTGFVHGQPAGSQDEERFARAFDKFDQSFQYQLSIPTDYSMPDQDKKLDFLIERVQPFDPRGHISHFFSIAQEAHDRVRELQLNEQFRRFGWRDLLAPKYTEYVGQVEEYTRRNLVVR
jgi:hypothetical protein